MALKDIAIKLTATGSEQVAREMRATQSATQQMAAAAERAQKMMGDTSTATGMARTVTDAMAAAASAIEDLGGRVKSAIIGAAAGFLAWDTARVIKDVELLAARYGTLGVVMNVIGANSGYTASQMAVFQQSLQKSGISAIESRQGLALMGQAQVDMANSSKLARIAQDAAVVGNINSSEAFNRMVTGLATGQSILLHHLGLMTNFETAYINAAHAAGKTTNELSENEKVQIRVNEVIRAGVGIQGAYESAMGTVGKQLTSLPRYIQDLMVKVGELGQGPLYAGVVGLTDLLKFLTKNFEDVAAAASAIGATGAAVAFGVLASKSADYAASLALASQHAEALRMNTMFNATASKAAAEAKVAETTAQIASNQARVAAIDAYIAENVANYKSVGTMAERATADAAIVGLESARKGVALDLAAAETTLTSQSALLATATEAESAAMFEASLAGRAMAASMAGLNAVMALVGGPIGLIAIAIAGVTYEVIKFMEKAEEAQNNLMRLQNQGEFAQTIAKLKEIEDLNRKLEQEKKSPADVARESTSAMQEKINKAIKENIELVKQRADLDDLSTARDTWTGKATELDKINARINDNNNLIKYGMKVNEEMNSALAKQATLRKALHPDKPADPPEMQDADEYGKDLRRAHESYLSYLDEMHKRELASEKNTRDLELGMLKHQKDQMLITEREYQQSALDAKVSASQKALAVAEEKYQEAVEYANKIDSVLKKQKDGTYAEGFLPDGSKVGVMQLNAANKAAEAARTQKEATETRLELDRQDQQAYGATNALLDARKTQELEIQKLEAEGNKLTAQQNSNLLRYADIWQKTGNQALVNLAREIDDLKEANDLYSRQIAIINELAAMNAENAARAAAMVGVNPNTGVIDSIQGQRDHEMAVLEQAHKREMEMYNEKKLAAIDAYARSSKSAEDYAQTIGVLADIKNKEALAEQENALKTKRITTQAYTAQLAMAGMYTGLAGELFAGLASTQDQSSRKGFETAKAFNLAAAVMSTAQATIAQLTGPDAWTPAAWARSGVAAALGAMQIAKIASTSFGGGSASSASVPAGSFGGSGSTTAGSSIGAPVKSLTESQSEASLKKLADAAESASLAVAKVADGITKVSQLFETSYSQNVAKGLTSAKAQNGNSGLGVSAGGGAAAGAGVGGVLAGPAGALIGAAIGSVVGSLGNLMFGWGNGWYRKDNGLDLSLTGGAFSASQYSEMKKDGGWFTSGKSRTEYTPLDDKLAATLTRYTDDLKATISNAAVALGTGTDFARAGAVSANVSTAGKSPEDIQKELATFYSAAADSLAKTVKGMEDLSFFGENAFDALVRLSTSLQGVNELFELTGHTLVASTLKGANAAYLLTDAFKGVDKMTESVNGYFDAMFTEAQKNALKAAQETRQVNSAFAQMGLAVPATKAGFISLVNSLDVTDAASATLYKSLMDIAPAFADAADQAEKLIKAQTSLNQDLAVRTLKLAGYNNEADLLALQVKQEEELASAREQGLNVTGLLVVQQREYASQVLAIQKAAHDKVIQAEKSLLNERLATAQKSATSWRSASDSLKSAVDNLTGAAMSPAGALASARSGFNAALSAARTGSVDDAQRLSTLATGYLDALKASGATGIEQQLAAATLRSQLAEVQSLTGSRASFAERQVNVLEEQLKVLNAGADDAAATLKAAQADYAATLKLATTATATLTQQAQAAAVAHADAQAIVAAVRGGRPSYAVGSAFIADDMTADIHRGEKVIDAQSAAILNRYGIRVKGGSGDNTELASLLKAVLTELADVKGQLAELRGEQKAGLVAVAKNTGDTARQLKRWDGDAVPTREVAA